MNRIFATTCICTLAIMNIAGLAGCAHSGPRPGRWTVEADWNAPPDPDCETQNRVVVGALTVSLWVPTMVAGGGGIVFDGGMFGGDGPLAGDTWLFDPATNQSRKIARSCGLPFAVVGDDLVLDCERQLASLSFEDGVLSPFKNVRAYLMAASGDHIAWVTAYDVNNFENCARGGRSEFSLVVCNTRGQECRTLAALPEQPNAIAFGDNTIAMSFGGSVGGIWVVGLDDPGDGTGLPPIGIHRDWATSTGLVTAAGDDWVWFERSTNRLIRHNKQFNKNAAVIVDPVCNPRDRKANVCGMIGIAATPTHVYYLTNQADLLRVESDGRNPARLWSGEPCTRGCTRPLIVGDEIFFIHNWNMVRVKLDGRAVQTIPLTKPEGVN